MAADDQMWTRERVSPGQRTDFMQPCLVPVIPSGALADNTWSYILSIATCPVVTDATQLMCTQLGDMIVIRPFGMWYHLDLRLRNVTVNAK
jgi:hypothetical protein